MDPVVGICEDDHGLRGALVRALESEGYAIRTASTGHEAMASFGNGNVDVLFLTARDALVDRLAGFGAGGDDYLTKPFALAELLVRLRALLRRVAPAAPDLPSGLRLDPA